MADLLRRGLAPLTEDAWEELDKTAARVLKTLLTARTVVDFEGPHGWELGAVNLGQLEIGSQPGPQGIPWGIRKVLPLVELRVPFKLSQLELDNISRRSKDPDLGPMEDAARRIAWFEDAAIYKGFPQGNIQGILERSEHEAVPLPESADDYPVAIARGIEELKLAGVPGPYALVLGRAAFSTLMNSGRRGYPAHRIARDLLGGSLLLSTPLEGGLLLSTAEDNFEMTVGQDLAIGYATHDRDTVELYFAESFTFRVLEPAAALALQAAAQAT